jgi:hypothetical protein
MSKLVCGKCKAFLYLATSGVAVLEMAGFGPYKLWLADLWRCHVCHQEVISGFGDGPIAQHFEDDFAGVVHSFRRRGNLVRAHHIASSVAAKQ